MHRHRQAHRHRETRTHRHTYRKPHGHRHRHTEAVATSPHRHPGHDIATQTHGNARDVPCFCQWRGRRRSIHGPGENMPLPTDGQRDPPPKKKRNPIKFPLKCSLEGLPRPHRSVREGIRMGRVYAFTLFPTRAGATQPRRTHFASTGWPPSDPPGHPQPPPLPADILIF